MGETWVKFAPFQVDIKRPFCCHFSLFCSVFSINGSLIAHGSLIRSQIRSFSYFSFKRAAQVRSPTDDCVEHL